MSNSALLARAAAAYRRAGATDAAARCYAEAGHHLPAATYYLLLRRYDKAASQYILGARSEMAAWVYAHHLKWTDLARDIVADFDGNRTGLRRAYEKIAIGGRTRLLPDTWPLLPADADVAAMLSTMLTELSGTGPLSDPERAGVLAGLLDWRHGNRDAGIVVPDLIRHLIIARCDVADRVHHRDVLPVLAASRTELAAAESPDPLIEKWSIAIADEIHRYDQAALIFAAAVKSGSPGAATRWREWAARVLGAELILPGAGGIRGDT